MSFKVSNVYKSLVRHLIDTIDEIKASGVSPDLTYYAWDSRGDDSELPSCDLIGLAGWTFTENRGLWQVSCGMTISTYNDENLFREIEIVDEIHERWGELCVIPLRDDAGSEFSQLMVQEFEMLPAGLSERRNFRPIGLTLMRTANDG